MINLTEGYDLRSQLTMNMGDTLLKMSPKEGIQITNLAGTKTFSISTSGPVTIGPIPTPLSTGALLHVHTGDISDISSSWPYLLSQLNAPFLITTSKTVDGAKQSTLLQAGANSLGMSQYAKLTGAASAISYLYGIYDQVNCDATGVTSVGGLVVSASASQITTTIFGASITASTTASCTNMYGVYTTVAGTATNKVALYATGGHCTLVDNVTCANPGVGIVNIGNCTTAPTSNPLGGVFLYSESGTLKCLNPGTGPVTIVSPCVKENSVTLTSMSGATVTATSFIPSGALVLGVTCVVDTLITGATSFDIGDGTDVDRWGNSIGVALATSTTSGDFTIPSPVYYGLTGSSVVLTANGSNFTAGAVTLKLYYMSMPPY